MEVRKGERKGGDGGREGERAVKEGRKEVMEQGRSKGQR